MAWLNVWFHPSIFFFRSTMIRVKHLIHQRRHEDVAGEERFLRHEILLNKSHVLLPLSTELLHNETRQTRLLPTKTILVPCRWHVFSMSQDNSPSVNTCRVAITDYTRKMFVWAVANAAHSSRSLSLNVSATYDLWRQINPMEKHRTYKLKLVEKQKRKNRKRQQTDSVIRNRSEHVLYNFFCASKSLSCVVKNSYTQITQTDVIFLLALFLCLHKSREKPVSTHLRGVSSTSTKIHTNNFYIILFSDIWLSSTRK